MSLEVVTRADVVERLVRYRADVSRHRADGATAHTLAELHGNADIAAWLLAHGAHDELSAVDRFAAACACANCVRAAGRVGARF